MTQLAMRSPYMMSAIKEGVSMNMGDHDFLNKVIGRKDIKKATIFVWSSYMESIYPYQVKISGKL